MKKLSIVIPCYNKWNFTKSCLSDLLKLPSDHEIIIDNGSSDETQKELEKYNQIVYHRNDINEGFARACNKGYNLATSSNVLFLNNDIRVKSNYDDWTKEIIEKCDLGLIGPTMGQLDNNLNFVREYNGYLDGNSYMSGWCLAASKNIWEKLKIKRPAIKTDIIPQIFSEDFFCYFEDTDLSFRAKNIGISMHVVDIPVVHFGKTSSRQLNVHQLYLKSREIFIKKWKV